MKDIIIYGAGGLGLEIKALIENINEINPEWNFLGFVDDKPSKEILGGFDYLERLNQKINLVIAIGDPLIKSEVIAKTNKLRGVNFPVLIHPKATLMDSKSIKIDEGTVLCTGAVLTTNINVGKHVLINLNSTIGHGCQIGEGCSIMPGVNLAGDVRLDQNVLIGSGANILNGLTIGENSKVGSGAVVTKSVSPGKCVIGIPAKEK